MGNLGQRNFRARVGSVLLAGAVVLSVAVMPAGCGRCQPYLTDQRLERGLVIVLPGIEGRSPLNEMICQGLDLGGVDWAIELYDWTGWLGPLYNLRNVEGNRRAALRIAHRVAAYQWEHPARPVVLVGQSGGGAIAAWVAESMPAGQKLDGIVMLAAALSPRYTLEWALEGTRRGIVSFHSGTDVILLGLGTTIAGTMDGHHASSAGRTGFEVPAPGGTPEPYRKLFQVPWTKEMSVTGHVGGHLSSGASYFVATYVAPLVLSPEWNGEVVGKVVQRKLPRPATQRAPGGEALEGPN